MEVTKQKMRCAAAEDPCYPCKHEGEGRVSQLRGEEVTAASPGGGAPGIAAGCWGRADIRPRGGHGGVPVKLGAGELHHACGRARLAITMSLCAGTAVPNGAEKRPCRAPVGNGGPSGGPGDTRACVCPPPGGCASPKGSQQQGHPRVCCSLCCLRAPGDPKPPGEAAQGGVLLPWRISPGADKASGWL